MILRLPMLLQMLPILVFGLLVTSCSAGQPEQSRAVDHAVDSMLSALGGRENWAELKSLYICAEHTEPGMAQTYWSEIARLIGEPQVRIDQYGIQNGEPFRIVRVLDEESSFRVDLSGERALSKAVEDFLRRWDNHVFYAALVDLAEDQVGTRAVRQEGANRIIYQRENLGEVIFELNENHIPIRYGTPDGEGGHSFTRYTAWAATSGLVHPIRSETEAGAVYKTKLWLPFQSALPVKLLRSREFIDMGLELAGTSCGQTGSKPGAEGETPAG